jgi:hypothetical protein
MLDRHAKTWTLNIMNMEGAGDVEVDTTINRKAFFNYTTRETVVKVNDGTGLHYWLTDGDFSFYNDALAWVAFDNVFYRYFFYLPSRATAMPLLVTQQNARGGEEGRLEVTRMEKHAVDKAMFSTPAGYKKGK